MSSGAIAGTSEDWGPSVRALRNGRRGLPRCLSLAELLAERRGAQITVVRRRSARRRSLPGRIAFTSRTARPLTERDERTDSPILRPHMAKRG